MADVFSGQNFSTALPVVAVEDLPSAKQPGILLAILQDGVLKLAVSNGESWTIFGPE